MIRQKTKIDIYNALNRHKNFIPSDFDITYKDETVRIVYEYENNYVFSVTFPSETSKKTVESSEPSFISIRRNTREVEYYQLKGYMRPGELVLTENIAFESDELRSKINQWLNCIWQELNSNPISKNLSLQSENFEKLKSKLENISEDYFTKEEGEEIKLKLKTLEEELRKKIEEVYNEKSEQSKQIKDLREQIDILSKTIFSLNKKNWFKSSITKIYKWISEDNNRKLLKDGASVVKHFLPESND